MSESEYKALKLEVSVPSPLDPSMKTELTGFLYTMVSQEEISEAKGNWESLVSKNTLDLTPFVKYGLLKKESKKYVCLRDNVFTIAYEYLHDTLASEVNEIELINLYGMYFAWNVFIDDVYDTLLPTNFPQGGIETIRKANKVWMNILMKRYGNNVEFRDLPQINGFPVYEPFSRVTIDLHRMLTKVTPELHTMDEFWATLGLFFSSMEFKLGNPEVCFDSENFFQSTQRMSCGAWNGFMLVAHVQGLRFPDVLEHNVLLNILKLTVGNIGTSISDLNGLGKDIAEGDKNNLVLFKAAFENWTMQQAFTYVVEYFNQNIKDMGTLINVLKNQYSTNIEVHKYLDGITRFIEKSIVWGAVCQRYHDTEHKSKTLQS